MVDKRDHNREAEDLAVDPSHSRRAFLRRAGTIGLISVPAAGLLSQTAMAGKTGGGGGNLPWIDVTSFGADPTGANDSTSAIQSAFNSVPDAGGMVFIPRGTFKISSTLRPKTNTKIFGMWGDQRDGTDIITNGSCLMWQGPGNTAAVSLFGVNYVDIDGLNILNANSAPGMTGLLIDSDNNPPLHNVSVQHVVVRQFQTGIWNGTSPAHSYQCDTVTIRQSRIIGDGSRGSVGVRVGSDNAMDGGGLFTVSISYCDYSIWIDAIGMAMFDGVFDGGAVAGGSGTAFIHMPLRHDALVFRACETEGHDSFLSIPASANRDQANPIVIESSVVNAPINIGTEQRIVSIGNTLNAPCTLLDTAAFGARLTSIGDGGPYRWAAQSGGKGNQVLSLTPGDVAGQFLVLSPGADGAMLVLRPNSGPAANPNLTLDGSMIGAHTWSIVLPGSAGQFRPSQNLVFYDATRSQAPLQLHDNGIQIADASSMYSGNGAPNIQASVAGDFYFRKDTPTTPLQRIYVATGPNTWQGIV